MLEFEVEHSNDQLASGCKAGVQTSRRGSRIGL